MDAYQGREKLAATTEEEHNSLLSDFDGKCSASTYIANMEAGPI